MSGTADLDSHIKAELGATAVGPSMWGTIYRHDDGSGYLRIIPNDLARTTTRLREVDHWQCEPTDARLAPVAGTTQRQFGTRWFRVVDYRIAAQHTLAEVLCRPDPVDRVEAVVAALRALPGWWAAVGAGFLPLPADIVFVDDVAQLLRTPCWDVPDVGELLSAPDRVLHLPPEVVSGATTELDERADIYSVTAMALRCFVTPATLEPGTLLHHSACGVALCSTNAPSRLPLWMDRQPPVREAVEAMTRVVDADDRGPTDLAELTTTLSAGLAAMEPLAYIDALRSSRQPGAAMGFARMVMPESPSYELFLRAAEIAWRDLHDPLEALSLLDKAVYLDETRVTAYRAQFAIISTRRHEITVLLRSAINSSFTDRLDQTIENAYAHLPEDERADLAHDMATYLIERGRLRDAGSFLYEALHDGDTELWWRFDLMLDYAETFLRLDDPEAAEAVANQVRSGLRKVRQNQTVPLPDILRHGRHLTAFDLRLHQHRESRTAT